MSDFARNSLINRLNTLLRNEVMNRNIDPISIQQQLSGLNIHNYHQPSLNQICGYRSNNNYPPRENMVWEIFNSLTMDQLLLVKDLLQ